MSIIGTLQPGRPHPANEISEPDSELVSSRFDRVSETNFYTRESYSGRRTTVAITNYEFDRDCGSLAQKDSKARRRQYLAQRFLRARPHDKTSPSGGVFERQFSPIAEANAGLDISATRLEGELDRLAAAIDAVAKLK